MFQNVASELFISVIAEDFIVKMSCQRVTILTKTSILTKISICNQYIQILKSSDSFKFLPPDM